MHVVVIYITTFLTEKAKHQENISCQEKTVD